MAKSVARLLIDTAALQPEKSAVRFMGTSFSYNDIDLASNRLAHALQSMDIHPGDRVALYCINSPQFMISYFGILKAGAIVVPLNLLLHPEEIAFLLNDSGARAVIYHEIIDQKVKQIQPLVAAVQRWIAIGKSELEQARPFNMIMENYSPGPLLIEPRSKDDIAAILYTGGTTGTPKGAMLTHENLLCNVESVIKALKLEGYEDTFLTVLPMFHSFGATVGFLTPVANGSTVVAVPQFTAESTCQVIHSEHATIFMGVPTMFAMMANLPDDTQVDLSSLRFCVSGGSAMPLSVLERFEKRYGILIYEGDGPTECSPVTCVNPIGEKRKLGSVGKEVPGVEMIIMDDHGVELPVNRIGEVCVRGKNVMRGYWRQPEETANSFFGDWFRTGDLGKMDHERYFYLVDRRKDMIIVHGINLYPRQVEEVIYSHPAVAEAAVIGIPDELHGELPKAFVALKAGYDIKPNEIIQHCRKHLGRFEVPRRVEILPQLPKSAAGKILKRELRDQEIRKKTNSK